MRRTGAANFGKMKVSVLTLWKQQSEAAKLNERIDAILKEMENG